MDESADVIARLASAESYGYHPGSPDAAEPVALAATALIAARRESQALPLLDWLVERQSDDGRVGIDADDATPGWPTGWAVIAWRAAASSSLADARFAAAVDRGISWLLGTQGELIEFTAGDGHNTMLKGWPWVQGTHAWQEPTAMNLLALKHAGFGNHARAREAVRMLQDRLLPSGGCNYGNTIVFGQELRAHVEPTGVCLLALAGETDPDGRTEKAIAYLERELSARTTSVSLAYALMGLAAQGRYPAAAGDWLAAASRRTLSRDPGAYKLALLALAAAGTQSPLIPTSDEAIAP